MFRLACLFAFSLSLGSAQGTLRLEKTTLTVQTRTLEMKFDQGAVISVRNRLTGEEYVQRPGPRWFEMTHMDPRPGGLNTGRWKLVEEGGPRTGSR